MDEIRIPMQDRALFFGDGVYDVTFANNGRLFAMEDHLDRFYNSCRMMRIDFPLNREELTAEIQKCGDAPETGNRPSTGNRAAATVPVTMCSRIPPANRRC
ncbi:MAG: aminotransferase class IV [Galactobacillus timonensis]|uniref:aminotransferase class IV n=1 Tax=Galactobacillus timonensis TaxID=2041840 RepID=UPI0023F0B5DA|nr:aminotransferase class IV [Galactobacillus timonensis]MCI6068111.1 aminotransferase class IV [Galactobacillus timonensis]